MKLNIYKYLILILLLVINISSAELSMHENNKLEIWEGGLRSFNIKLSPKFPNFNQLHNEWGINLVRLSCNNLILRSKSSPYEYIEENWYILDSWIDSLNKYGKYVVLDPHTFPGTKNKNTTYPSDLIWQEKLYQDMLIETWEKISKRYREYDNIIGYDLINEPTFYRNWWSPSALDYDSLIIAINCKIRKFDNLTPIIIELPRYKNEDRIHFEFFNSKIKNIQNAIFSTHYYYPPEFTRQGLNNRKERIIYPGFLTSVSTFTGNRKELIFDKEGIKETLASARKFQLENKCIIFIGEFSCLMWPQVETNILLI